MRLQKYKFLILNRILNPSKKIYRKEQTIQKIKKRQKENTSTNIGTLFFFFFYQKPCKQRNSKFCNTSPAESYGWVQLTEFLFLELLVDIIDIPCCQHMNIKWPWKALLSFWGLIFSFLINTYTCSIHFYNDYERSPNCFTGVFKNICFLYTVAVHSEVMLSLVYTKKWKRPIQSLHHLNGTEYKSSLSRLWHLAKETNINFNLR